MAETVLLKQLLGDFPTEKFISEYWGKNWLYLDEEQRGHKPFPIGIGDIDSFFTSARLRYPWVKLVSQVSELPLKEFRNENFPPQTDFIDNEKLFAHLDKGYSIVVNSADKSFEPISALCRKLEQELLVKVWANMYISPPGSTGFGIHQDVHDIIILQLSGHKDWGVYPMEAENLGPRPPGPDDRPLGEFQMNEGDVIYLPKNQPHMAAAGSTRSVHIALGLEGLFWDDVLKQFLENGRKRKEFRQRVPSPLQGKEAFNEFLGAFKNAWNDLLTENPAEQLVNDLMRSRSLQADAHHGKRLSTWLATDSLSVESQLRKSPYVALEVLTQKQFFYLKFQNKQLRFPSFLSDLVRKLVSEAPYKLSDISCSQNDEEKLKVAKKLLKAGLLEVHA